MTNIILLCNQGLSTSALVKKMESIIQEDNLSVRVEAHAIDTAQVSAKDADIILLGPQIRYKLNAVKELFPKKPVQVIDMADYGMMNGRAVVEKALKELE
ncbi:PTS sugar transporter subunit IIB [Streptococcus pluranimalium]|uniref:PTS sugar transporter subunit IIB n=1 Tax=Streptococcus pluranimalium TaxID=82348 RepID=UPI0039FBD48E